MLSEEGSGAGTASSSSSSKGACWARAGLEVSVSLLCRGRGLAQPLCRRWLGTLWCPTRWPSGPGGRRWLWRERAALGLWFRIQGHEKFRPGQAVRCLQSQPQ